MLQNFKKIVKEKTFLRGFFLDNMFKDVFRMFYDLQPHNSVLSISDFKDLTPTRRVAHWCVIEDLNMSF